VQRLVFVVGPCQLSTRNGAAMGRVMQRSGVALDATGNPYVAGTRQGGDSGNGLLATKTHLDVPLALRVSPSGVVYVDDGDDGLQYRVRKIQ